MNIINFAENLPIFGEKKENRTTITTKKPYEIFKGIGTTVLGIKCSCQDPTCTNMIYFNYSGLEYYFGSRNLGSDTHINILNSYKDEGKADNVMYEPSKENLSEFISFFHDVQKAVNFKKEILNGLYAQLQINIKNFSTIELMVRKTEKEFVFILFEIGIDLPNIPLISEAKDYKECLGVIAKIPVDTDVSKIKNDYADMNNPFFKPVIEWAKLLGQENNVELEIRNIWVMPE